MKSNLPSLVYKNCFPLPKEGRQRSLLPCSSRRLGASGLTLRPTTHSGRFLCSVLRVGPVPAGCLPADARLFRDTSLQPPGRALLSRLPGGGCQAPPGVSASPPELRVCLLAEAAPSWCPLLVTRLEVRGCESSKLVLFQKCFGCSVDSSSGLQDKC